jgi:hypothetical protein
MVAWKMYNIKLPFCVNVEALRRIRNLLGEERTEYKELTSLVSTVKYPSRNVGRCVRKEWESGTEKDREYTNHTRGPPTSRLRRSRVLVAVLLCEECKIINLCTDYCCDSISSIQNGTV